MKRCVVALFLLIAALVGTHTPDAHASSYCHGDPLGDANLVSPALELTPLNPLALPVSDSRADFAQVCVTQSTEFLTVRFDVPDDTRPAAALTDRTFYADVMDYAYCGRIYVEYFWGAVDSATVRATATGSCEPFPFENSFPPTAVVPGATFSHVPGSGQFSVSVPMSAVIATVSSLSGYPAELIQANLDTALSWLRVDSAAPSADPPKLAIDRVEGGF